jgi:uncharacterized protein YacL (UPF0231 family)
MAIGVVTVMSRSRVGEWKNKRIEKNRKELQKVKKVKKVKKRERTEKNEKK